MASDNPAEPQFRTFDHQRLRDFTKRVFVHFGVPADEAETAAGVLSRADLRGIDSHGVARLHAYVTQFRDGRLNPRPQISIVRESPSTATVDGDNGLGLVVGPHANQICMEKAGAVGTGWVAVRNSHHFGIASYYTLAALEHDMIGWAMTNATNQVAPAGGRDRMLGTNPVAISFPASDKERSVVIDMATSVAAYGKIEIALRRGEPIPTGWLLDSSGHETTNPATAGDDYAMLPLGSDKDRGAHKGYCLGAMVDLLCGPLSGANWGPFTPPLLAAPGPLHGTKGAGLGHFFGAMRIDAFIDPAGFKQQVDDWIKTFRNSTPAPGVDCVRIPGDPEREAEAIRRREGVPIIAAVQNDLERIARETGEPL